MAISNPKPNRTGEALWSLRAALVIVAMT